MRKAAINCRLFLLIGSGVCNRGDSSNYGFQSRCVPRSWSSAAHEPPRIIAFVELVYNESPWGADVCEVPVAQVYTHVRKPSARRSEKNQVALAETVLPDSPCFSRHVSGCARQAFAINATVNIPYETRAIGSWSRAATITVWRARPGCHLTHECRVFSATQRHAQLPRNMLSLRLAQTPVRRRNRGLPLNTARK